MKRIAIVCVLCLSAALLGAAAQQEEPEKGSSTPVVPRLERVPTLEKAPPPTPEAEPSLRKAPAVREDLLRRAPDDARLVRQGSKLLLDLDASPERIEILAGKKRLARLPGKGRKRFDLTPYLKQATDGRLTVQLFDARGQRTVRELDVSAHRKALLGKSGVGEQPDSMRVKAPKRELPGRAEPGAMVPFYLEHGLRISEPREGQLHRRGGTIDVHLEVLRDVPGDTPYTVTLRRRGSSRTTVMHRGTLGTLPDDGALPPWTIPNIVFPGVDYYVRAEAGDLEAESHDFSIDMVRVLLSVVSPNGGESWAVRSAQEIVWQGASDVTVELLAGGTPRLTLSGEPDFDRATNTYRLRWFVPSDLSLGGGYSIRVTDATGRSDESNGSFAIRAQRAGDTQIWVEAGPPPGLSTIAEPYVADEVRVETRCDDAACRGGDMRWTLVSESAGVRRELRAGAVDSCNRTETFPLDSPARADDYHVLVFYGTCMGVSDAFGLEPALPSGPLVVHSPAAGARWLPGETHRVEWSDSSPRSATRTFTLMNGYDEVGPIASGPIEYDTGAQRWHFDWVVPDVPDRGRDNGNYAIRIVDVASGSMANSGFFTIAPSGLRFSAPSAGRTYRRLNFLPVSWTVVGAPAGPVNVDLVRYGASSTEIVRSHPVDAPIPSFFLDPDRVAPAENYQVLASDPRGNVVGTSGVFAIADPELTLTSPRGEGLVVADGERLTVAWRLEGAPPGGGIRGTLDVVNGRGSVTHLCQDLDLSLGTFSWRVGWVHCPGDPVSAVPFGVGTLTTGPWSGTGYVLRLTLNAIPGVVAESTPFEIVPE